MISAPFHCGWAGPDEAKRAWDLIGHLFAPFKIFGAEGPFVPQRSVLWDAMRKVLGSYLPNIPQEIGDCVSWGCRNAVDHSAACEIAAGQREILRPSFPPYFYGISRWQEGRGRLGSNDGSTGAWAAAGVREYGVLAANETGVPKYSGAIAKQWGMRGPPQNFITLATPHTFQTAARLHSIEDVALALMHGFGVTIASNRGYAMKLVNANGKSWFTGRDTWPHQMSLLGVDVVGNELCFYRMNSWGPNAHGPQLDGPPGGGWIHGNDLAQEIADPGVEVFAFSGFNGFVAKKRDWSLI